MTRMDVFMMNINPNLAEFNEAMVMRYVGEKSVTSIRRNQYIQVQYEFYQIPDFETLTELSPNNYKVEAYYMPSDDIKKVFLFQDDRFVCEAKKIVEYNVALAEKTELDKVIHAAQGEFVKQHDEAVKEGKKKLAKVELVEKTTDTYHENTPAETVMQQHENSEEWAVYDYETDAVDSL